MVKITRRLPEKGAVKKQKAQEEENTAGRPAHIDREPASSSFLSEFMSNGTTVSFPTHSHIAPLPRPPVATSLLSEFERKKKEAIEVFDQVVAACQENGNKRFFDKEFHFMSREFLYPPGSPDDCTVGEVHQVRYAEDVFGEQTKLFDGSSNYEVDSSDLVQGCTGDCFLIGAVAALAHKLEENFTGEEKDPIKRLFVACDTKLSVYTLLFYVNSAWEWIIVDGSIACNAEGEPLYANCGEQENELWPVILEKAYFKLFKSVDTCDGGASSAALQTLTAGVRVHVDLNKITWKQFVKMARDPHNVLSCSVRPDVKGDGGEAGSAGEESGPFGLFKGHAYSILEAKSIGKKAWISVKNPWASGEYTGDWSDNSPLWEQNPEIAQELNHTVAEDGIFWMSAVDFKKLMEFDMVHFFPDNYQVLTFSNAFGAGPHGQDDDIFVLKLDAPTKLQVIVGQEAPEFAPAILGENEQNHTIAKGLSEWEARSYQLGVRVSQHTKNMSPTSATYARSKKKELASLAVTGSQQCYVEVDAPAGYVSVTPFVDDGCTYYVRVVAPPESNVTMYNLSSGLGNALGNLDDLEIEEEPDNMWDDYEDEEEEEEEYEDSDSDDECWEDEEELAKVPTKEELKEIFKEYDYDGSGYLEKTEMFALLTHYFPAIGPKACQAKIRSLDSNNDNKISFSEFRRGAKSLLMTE